MEASKDLNIPLGAPVWMDLVTNDVEGGVAFYTQLFGWQIQDTPPEFEGYKYFTKNGDAVGGCMHNSSEFGMPNVWSIFLRTDDASTTEALAKEHGGEVLMPTMKVGENGSFTIVRDPGGAVISAWQPDKESGFGVMYEADAPAHFELHTREYAKSIEFYRNVFGWNPQTLVDEPNFKYTGFGPAESPAAGIMDSSGFPDDSMPTTWSVYIASADADKTIEKAISLGAKLLQGPDATPYGRLATLADPAGTVFKIQS